MPFYSQIIFVGTGDKSKINLWIQIRALYLVVRLRARWNFWLKFKITVNSYIFGVVIFTVSFYFPRLESDTRCDMLLTSEAHFAFYTKGHILNAPFIFFRGHVFF